MLQILKMYYLVKPIIPRRLQIYLRRRMVLRKRQLTAETWPIDRDAAKPPENWHGWPDNKKFALILTHDVDTAGGQEKCLQLHDIEKGLGFRSSFNFVPRRYTVSGSLREYLAEAGFEIGVHGLYHDGKYYESRQAFERRAVLINSYLKDWGCVGFRSPSMLHNLEWISDLNIEYDASTFDTDPFEPQSDGVKTIYPFSVKGANGQHYFVELPYTLPQDFTLFILMKEKNIDIWKRKLAWIVEKGGMALLNVHPDYMSFGGKKLGLEEYPASYYRDFLEHVQQAYEGQYWHVLPRDLARYWESSFEAGTGVLRNSDTGVKSLSPSNVCCHFPRD